MGKKKKLGGGQTCCVPNCNNNTLKHRHFTWHSFPTNPKYRTEWLRRINRVGAGGRYSLWEPGKHHKICGAHFNTSGRRGYMDRLPTIFSHRRTAVAESETRPAAQLQDELSIALNTEIHIESSGDHRYTIPGCPSEVLSANLAKVHTLTEACEKLEQENAALKAKNVALAQVLSVVQNRRGAQPTICHSKVTKVFKSKLDMFIRDEKTLQFYTGFSSRTRFDVFLGLVTTKYNDVKSGLGRPCVLSVAEQLVLVLARLRVVLLEQDLAIRFDVHVSTVSNLFTFWVDFLYSILTQLPIWPSRTLVDQFMPEGFQLLYPSTRIILDCTELFIEIPSDFRAQSDTYSSYKSHNTAKGLIGITPNGLISFISDLSPGRISDRDIVRLSGLYNLLEPGDSVMADRGFLIANDLEERGVKLNIPPMLKGRAQLPRNEESETRKLANLRVHVERAIREVKNFRILHNMFPNTMASKLNKIWKICCHLNNFIHEPLLDRTKIN
ncbi:uncharacterized protein LOC135384858 [Ornithodoros turicata]|uniref:uncharacterized protein LOC135384858 n=1 Tax=Ornithodoros turicata TaxID=34597 RepID=UPI0031391982